MDLPRKDKQGVSYLSYSQINTYLKYRQDYIDSYILNKPIEPNKWMDFGLRVGSALEKNDYSTFTNKEKDRLKECIRLDVFEREVKLRYDGFYILGYIDTCSGNLDHIIDYKTGGKNKEYQYLDNDYWQLCYYALSIKQETGSVPSKAQVNFIRRSGYEHLSVADESPFLLDVDISLGRLKNIYWRTIEIAEEIQTLYHEITRKAD